jgi:hypothetical protein
LVENALSPKVMDFFRTSNRGPNTNTGVSSFSKGMDLIAGQEKDYDEIDTNDLEKLIQNPEGVTTNVQYALIYFTKLGEMSDEQLTALKEKAKEDKTGAPREASKIKAGITFDFLSGANAYGKIRELAKKAREVLTNFEKFRVKGTSGPQSISNPNLNPSRIELGDLPQDYVKIIEGYLGSDKDIVSRLTKISEVSDKYFNEESGTLPEGQSISKTLTEIMILDLFNHVVKELDSGSGAYFFEAILALLCVGQSTGKSMTKAGKAGAYDFIDASGNYGSAKYFTEANSELKQAIAGFEDIATSATDSAEVNVRYVIALKKQDEEQLGAKTRGSADPRKIVMLQIYTPLVTYDPKDKTFKIDGDSWTGTKKVSDGNIYFHKWINANRPSTVLRLARIRTETFRTGIENKIQTEKSSAVKAFGAWEKYFEFLTSAEEQARIYSSTADVTDGVKTIGQLNSAEVEINNLMAAFEMEQKENILAATNEHKITADLLKKLIQENFKK